MDMKIRFMKSLSVDVEKPRTKEVVDRSFRKWDELTVEEIYLCENEATIETYEGDFLLHVPSDSFEKIPVTIPNI